MFDFGDLPHKLSHYDVSFTLEIIDSFNDQTEESIDGSVKNYRSIGPETVEYDVSPDDGIFHTIDYYMGLDSNSVDLDDMFLSYYPSVTRRSAFLTLYGMLEHDFEKLCNGFAKVHTSPVKLVDLRGAGFERCDLFARKIIGMEPSQHYNLVKKITKLRNACAHNDARFVSNDGSPIAEIEGLMRIFPEKLCRDVQQVNFKSGSLHCLTNVLKCYFKDVESALEKHPSINPFITK